MEIGDRIKRARQFRNMTQKELGIAVGFDEKNADVRIAQYECNNRKPKELLLKKISEVLDVNYRSLYEPTLYSTEDIMYTLFELEEEYNDLHLYDVVDYSDPDFPMKRIAVGFHSDSLERFLREWQLRKKELENGDISKEEYKEWKLNWPQTADYCGTVPRIKEWRKKK